MKWLSIAFVVVLAATGSIVAVAQTRSDSDAPQAADHDPSGVAAPTITAIESGTERLGVFRRARTASDELPPNVADFVGRARPYGANPSLSRLALTPTGRHVYLVPAEEQVCVVVLEETGTALGCTLIDSIASDEGAPTSRTTDPATVVGVVPDGVQTVTVELANDEPVEVAVENNTYFADFGEGATLQAVSFTADDTTVRQEF